MTNKPKTYKGSIGATTKSLIRICGRCMLLFFLTLSETLAMLMALCAAIILLLPALEEKLFANKRKALWKQREQEK